MPITILDIILLAVMFISAMLAMVRGFMREILSIAAWAAAAIATVYLYSRLLTVVIAFLSFDWLVPEKSQPEWVRSAKSKVVLQGTGEWLKAQLPDDPESTILKRLKRPKPEDEGTDAPAGERSGLGNRLQ